MNESILLRYGVAIVLTILAVVLIYSRPVLMDSPYHVFLGAVILSAIYGGLAPAFVTTALSTLLVRFLFVQPYFSFYHKGNVDDAERICWFVLISLMSGSLICAVRKERNILRDSEERYRILAETASDAIIVIDEQETILFVNPVAERLFGAPATSMLGQHLNVLLPNEDYLPQLSEIKRDHDCRKKAVAFQLPGRHFNGEHILIEMTLGAFSKHGKNLFTAIIREVTGHHPLATPAHL